MAVLDAAGADLLFRDARTYNSFQDRPVAPETLRALHDLMKWAPTSANCSPLRIEFLVSAAAKNRLAPALAEGNRAKTLAAPVVAILAYDTRFFDLLPKLFPHNPQAREWFAGQPNAEPTAFRNSSLQGGYFILAARALGLDCGPMSGFDNAKADAEFFPDGRFRSNFLCNLGYGDKASLFPRGPRLSFDEACRIL